MKQTIQHDMLLEPVRDSDAMQLILKIAGSQCNLRCSYCYERRRRVQHENSMISADALRSGLKHLGDRPLSVQLHGGEPLLIGQERTRELLAVLRQRTGPTDLNIQTNGILLDESWLDLFDEVWPDIKIGISLDGDPTSNVYRMDCRDLPHHAEVESALRLCCVRQRNVGIIAVANSCSLGRAKDLLAYFAKFEAIRMINFTPCFDYSPRLYAEKRLSDKRRKDGQAHFGIPQWAISPAEYGAFVLEVFNAWKDDRYFEKFLLEPVFSVIRSLHGKPAPLCHFDGRKCLHMATLYPDGSMGYCDELGIDNDILEKREALIGTHRGSALQPTALASGFRALAQNCANCPYYHVCRGGCIATRLRYQGTALEQEYCLARAAIVDGIARAIEVPPIQGNDFWVRLSDMVEKG